MFQIEVCQCSDPSEFTFPGKKECIHCKPNDLDLEWHWQPDQETSTAFITGGGSVITFHRRYSSGTAVVRGDQPLLLNHYYYWEIEMRTTLYGTDIMVGVGTPNLAMGKSRHVFASFLGLDSESWGFSYTGKVQHAGRSRKYCSGFKRGDTIGVLLDRWQGTLAFYLNREPLGIAFRGLRTPEVLYPMVCSTAAQICMRLVVASSEASSLLPLCCRPLSLRPSALRRLARMPGLRELFRSKFWLLLPQQSFSDRDYEEEEENTFVYQGYSLFSKGALCYRTKMDAAPQQTTSDSDLMDNAVSRSSIWGEFKANEEGAEGKDEQQDSEDEIDSMSLFLPLSGELSSSMSRLTENGVKLVTKAMSPTCENCLRRPAILIDSQHNTKMCFDCFCIT